MLNGDLQTEDVLVKDITLIPPQDGNRTDEESGDEAEVNLNHLPARMLTATVEINVTSSADQDNVEESSRRTETRSSLPERKKRSEESTSASQITPPLEKKRKIVKQTQDVAERKWVNDERVFTQKSGRGDEEEFITNRNESNLSPVQCFELLFTDDIIDMIVKMSNLYALQQNHTLNMTAEELKVYLAVLLLTGYLTPQYTRMLWEVKSDTHNELVANSIRRNRFFEIQQYLHLCNNFDLPPVDKFGKVRKYFDMLNETFLEHFPKVASSHISVDETMVPYYGKHSAKQHIHGKPLRFGYKLWSAATRNGYLITFEPYQGAKSAALPNQDSVGLGAAVILEMHSRLPVDLGPYNLYFDNFFTSLSLLSILSEKGAGGTGTIRENRTQKCPLEDTKIMKKRTRGNICFKVDRDVLIAKWHDNSIVAVASNCHGVSPVCKVERIGVVEGKRTKIQVDCPALIQKYNNYMGGVDRFDENVDSLRVGHRGKKWWFPLFAFGLDAACQNAWQIMRRLENGREFTYCQFRRTVVQTYCRLYGKPLQKSYCCGSSVEDRVPSEIRRDGDTEEHVNEKCSQRRCALCHKRTRIMCKKCQVGLHLQCWYTFHTKK